MDLGFSLVVLGFSTSSPCSINFFFSSIFFCRASASLFTPARPVPSRFWPAFSFSFSAFSRSRSRCAPRVFQQTNKRSLVHEVPTLYQPEARSSISSRSAAGSNRWRIRNILTTLWLHRLRRTTLTRSTHTRRPPSRPSRRSLTDSQGSNSPPS